MPKTQHQTEKTAKRKSKRVVVKFGFLDDDGRLIKEVIRVFEWKKHISQKKFILEFDLWGNGDKDCDMKIVSEYIRKEYLSTP